MTRTLATACTVALLALSLTGCGGDDKAAKASPSQPDSSSSPESASQSPTEEATEATEAIEDVSSDAPTDAPAGAGVDGCALVPEALLTADLGFASGGQLLSQPSSFGDPNATDCFYAADSGDLIAVKATSRPATDLPESSSTTDGLPGAEKIDDVDWGSIYILSPSPTVASIVFARGDVGLQMGVTSTSNVTMDQLRSFAADVVAELG